MARMLNVDNWVRLIRQLKLTRAVLAVILLCGLITVLKIGFPILKDSANNQAALILFTAVITGLLGTLTILVKSIADEDPPK